MNQLHNDSHLIVPPTETIHQLYSRPSGYLAKLNVRYRTEIRQTVAEIPPSRNFDDFIWNTIEIIAALCGAAIIGITLFGFFMWVLAG